MSTNRKGQFFSYDAIIGAMIFVIAFGLLVSYWWSVRSLLNPEREDMLKEALRISDSLLTPGNPTDWEAHPPLASQDANGFVTLNTKMVGFADDYSNETLTQAKLAAFKSFVASSNANYQLAREQLIRTSYHFNISIESGGVIRDCFGECTMGKGPASSARNQVVVTRIAKYDRDNTLVNLKITLWT